MSTALFVVLPAVFAAPTSSAVKVTQLKDWDIVVAKQAVVSERYAAQEFRRFFSQATGIKLNIVESASAGSRKHVFIGEGPLMKGSPVGFSTARFGAEDFRIVVQGDNIAIAGGRPRGTLYGVYSFLEDYLGVRFLTVDHTHVPEARPAAAIPRVDRFYHPPMSYRYAAYQVNARNPTFAARLRCNTVTHDRKLGGITKIMLFGHSFYRQVPWKKYSKTNPEYFGIYHGKQITKERKAQLCLTNPDVLAIVTKSVLKELADNPQQRSIAVSQNDWGHKCECATCEKIDQREESGAGTLLQFVNAVAEKVAEKHPKVKVGTLAYYFSQKPPKTIKARSNVIIQLTTHDCSITDPIQTSTYAASAQFRRDLNGWVRICNHVNLWYYNTDFAMYHMPIPNIRELGPNVRYFVANNVQGMFAQSVFNAPHAGLNDLMNYMTARLLWDPQANTDVLMNEFLNLHYGEAGPLIRRFIDRMHDVAEKKGIQHGWVGRASQYGIDRSVVKLGVSTFDRAMRMTKDPTIRARIEKASIGIHMAALSEALAWTWPPKKGVTVPAAVARRTRPHFRQFFRLCKKYRITHWEEASTTETMRQYLKVGFGLKPDEAW